MALSTKFSTINTVFWSECCGKLSEVFVKLLLFSIFLLKNEDMVDSLVVYSDNEYPVKSNEKKFFPTLSYNRMLKWRYI